jgi:two-component system response regulator DctR
MSIAHLVDDDEAIRDSLVWLLRSRSIQAHAWSSAEDFLVDYRADMRGCLLLDIRMQAMSGLELFERLRALGCRMPAIFLTGHGDVPQAVHAIKNGAYDFIEKPCNDNELADRVIAAMQHDERHRQQTAATASVGARVQSLTSRERAVMDRILAGKYNKIIAAELNIAMRTVEVHRAHIFEKMDVKSAVELAQLLAGGPHS